MAEQQQREPAEKTYVARDNVDMLMFRLSTAYPKSSARNTIVSETVIDAGAIKISPTESLRCSIVSL